MSPGICSPILSIPIRPEGFQFADRETAKHVRLGREEQCSSERRSHAASRPNLKKDADMSDTPAQKLAFEDFIRVSARSAIEAIREQEKLDGLKPTTPIWVGLIIDPFGRERGPFGGQGGGVLGGGG